MSKFKVTTIFIALIVLGASFGLGQSLLPDQEDGYNSYSQSTGSKDMPAGFVNEPGSQLIFLLDTGINAVEMYGTDADFATKSIISYLGEDNSKPKDQNFISITNTNPSHAVTVHFRYFNSECEDFFDFLVVLTCNDTMMVDPFDFVVPGTSNINVKERIFGYRRASQDPYNEQTFDAITAEQFNDGRFLLFVTASGDVKEGYAENFDVDLDAYDRYNYGDIDLIPYEFINYREELLSVHCAAWEEATGEASDDDYDDAEEELFGVYNVYGNTPQFSDDNLHILNASAISFNFLVGFQTTAKVADSGNQAAYMIQAYARPAVVANATRGSMYETSWTGGPSGLGWLAAPIHVLLTGGETINTDADGLGDDISTLDGYVFVLRQEAHAGDQYDHGLNNVGCGHNAVVSEGGALGWEVFSTAAMAADKQVINLFSFMDNYNGEGNATLVGYADDLSYHILPVVTIYTVHPFNNSEDPWAPDPEDQPIVSPVQTTTELVSAIAVKCISTYQIDPETNINDVVLGQRYGAFTLQDLFNMNNAIGTDNKTLAGFMSVLAGSENELANEVGPGWVRLSRWFTSRKWKEDSNATYTTLLWRGENNGYLEGPSIFTAGQANYVFEDFGAGKWLSTVAGESQRFSD